MVPLFEDLKCLVPLFEDLKCFVPLFENLICLMPLFEDLICLVALWWFTSAPSLITHILTNVLPLLLFHTGTPAGGPLFQLSS